MDLYVLIAQRKERYEGEYGMEALAVMSEADYDENPDYLRDALEQNKASGEFDAIAIITLNISSNAVRAVLYPKRIRRRAVRLAAGVASGARCGDDPQDA